MDLVRTTLNEKDPILAVHVVPYPTVVLLLLLIVDLFVSRFTIYFIVNNKLSAGEYTMKKRDFYQELSTTKELVVREYIPANLISECPSSVIAVTEKYR